jgi:hypothetical protein
MDLPSIQHPPIHSRQVRRSDDPLHGGGTQLPKNKGKLPLYIVRKIEFAHRVFELGSPIFGRTEI